MSDANASDHQNKVKDAEQTLTSLVREDICLYDSENANSENTVVKEKMRAHNLQGYGCASLQRILCCFEAYTITASVIRGSSKF